MVPFPVTLSDP